MSGALSVSIVVVTRNRAKSLARTLEALKSLDYQDYEIIVVDNGSKDNTRKIVSEFGARYTFCEARHGIGYSRQKGVEESSGVIIAFCDDDCIPSKTWLTHIVKRFSLEPDVGLVAGDVTNIGFPEAKKYKGRSRLRRNGKLVFVENPADAEFFGNANMAIRKEVIELIQGYDPFFYTMEDTDIVMRVRKSGHRVAYEPEARLNHYYTGMNQKRRHLFFGPQLVRLYFCMKHQRPHTLRDWLAFWRLELRFVSRDLRRFIKAMVVTITKPKSNSWSYPWIDLFNSLSSRIAIPWLLWKAKTGFGNKR